LLSTKLSYSSLIDYLLGRDEKRGQDDQYNLILQKINLYKPKSARKITMRNASKFILIMAVTLLLSIVGMASAVSDFDDRYHDLRSEYYELTERYTDYREDYQNYKEYYDYNEFRYQRNLRELRSDFYALEQDANDLIEDIRDADGSESLVDDARDLREDAQSFQDRIDDLLNGEEYVYDYYGYFQKEVPKAVPEPPAKVESLNVIIVPQAVSTVEKPSPFLKIDLTLAWLTLAIIIVVVTIILLLINYRKR
jgi:DNA repair exonuclease SbcCD ATPase subunit